MTTLQYTPVPVSGLSSIVVHRLMECTSHVRILFFFVIHAYRISGKTGAAGVELSYNHVLSGRSGWELWTKTSSGYNKELVASNPAQQGSAVNLSLDRDIQCAAERALAQIKDSKGELLPGAAVMLDVNTGEILALASQPTFDPNRLADRVTQVYFDEVDGKGGWMNRAIQGLYAPGSTFKVITAIAGLRHGIVDWDDVLECGPSFRVGGRDFPEHDPAGYGPVNLEKMLAVSCNVWNYMVGVRLGQERLAAEARRFGLDTADTPTQHANAVDHGGV